mmetsp:Transcript_23205/g.17631  ORF Transcript_23205/g.17631 Transcript_23205/m.17631 type:complete len:159 (+) Transcript_23205:1168-1644(+)
MFQSELEQELESGKQDSDAFEERKKEFLYEINTSGKYHVLKEKLKKTIVRIVKEHFHKTGSIRGLYKDERDHFYSELYAYLVAAMRNTIQGMVAAKANELHLNVVPHNTQQMVQERDLLIEISTKEKMLQRNLRLCEEALNLGRNVAEAEKYMKKMMA